ncbi:putative secreted protein [Paenibacillus vortex V453]|jgi:hypothetical protein|uniref:Uncharacterized protein n=3 Tax=Paenibacillus TaxID=44249 RepID=A0A163KDK6_9BACL|nr:MULTISPECIES: hypothetical protein [Paenibacillus]ANA81106.1 hypothetical protein A3958_14480 [Paenibacillus glucanolyticus]AVV54776.1 hypothetical protein C7121_00730 [Paenibacillus glucanolyticus]AWP29424.1 hypothetical protein B9D94_23650 [Paenibacillus sp. Cedars]EFU42176.1 putative secreted protein [Paenibacillus vortex V453]ETT33727.1 putative secreted protein [Paenibacillus sp. FSL R5-808]
MNRKMIVTTAASLLVGVVAGTGIMMNDQAYQSVKQAVGGSATNNSIGQIDITSMDIETALMAVQQQRTQLLDTQLNNQIQDVQKRNEEIAKKNDTMAEINGALAGESVNGQYLIPDDLAAKLAAEGIADASKKEYTAEELIQATEKLKGSIDNLSNSQQMDMLQLQSMTNKRNEAFDVMSNFIKKMEDSRSSIIGNMR